MRREVIAACAEKSSPRAPRSHEDHVRRRRREVIAAAKS